MFKKAAILFLYAETPLHPGSGASVGAVDLPIQRERHTQHPIMQSSGIKGALRDLANRIGANEEKIKVVFGPEDEAQKHGGAISFTDARVLLFPVRSMEGVFAWITCPKVLERFNKDIAYLDIGLTSKSPPVKQITEIIQGIRSIPLRERGKVFITTTSDLIATGNRVILEEFSFEAIPEGKDRANELARWFAENAFPKDSVYGYWREEIKRKLAILSDDDFTSFVQFSTEVITRIKIEDETGTVKAGPWDEEYLPAETLLYSMALATDPKVEQNKRPNDLKDASGVLEFVEREILNRVTIVQLGGDETVGRGITRMTLKKNDNLKVISCKEGIK